MIFVSRELVLKRMIESDLPFYEVYDGNALVDQCQDETVTAANAAEQLRELLDAMSGGIATIKISAKTKKQKAVARDHSLQVFNVKLSNAPGAAINGIGNNADTIGAVERNLMAEIHSLKSQLIETEYKQQLKALEQKFDDLKNGGDDTIGKIAEALIMNYMAPQAAAPKQTVGIAGMEQEQPVADQTAAANKQRFASAVKILQSVDPDFIATIEAIANIAATDAKKYHMYANMLKG